LRTFAGTEGEGCVVSHRSVTSKQNSNAPTLREVQDRLQAAILDGDNVFLDLILDNSRTTRETLFGVYRNAYIGRLVEILQNEYPILSGYCGDERFRALAESYIAVFPSKSQNARWFGSRLPGFLGTSGTYGENPELADIAEIENAVSNAFDAVDAPVVDVGGLSQFPPDAWGKLKFAPHPSVARLDATTNAFAIWKSLKNGDAAPNPVILINAEHIVVWRQETTPMVRVMGREEAMMWTEASRGVRFEVLCEMLATFDTPETAASRAAGYLQSWLGAQMLMAVTLAVTPMRKTMLNSKSLALQPVRRRTARTPKVH
jgi:Putative DNA-binding domain